MTGDIDVTTPVQDELEIEAKRLGFMRPSGAGKSLRGWVHPDLGFGFEVVASTPMDGSVDSDHLVLVDDLVDGASFALISVEDLIADRMGQYASGTAPEMLVQARKLIELHPGADKGYLERRIRHETQGEYGIEDVEGR